MARTVLLADDSVTAQNMGRRILMDAGYEVVTVNNGSAALKKIHESHPDLIVLDVYMPGYGGLEVCQRLKESEDTARIPVLLSVGKMEPFKADEAKRVRADGHIVKPFEASELLAALTKLEDRIVPQAEPASGRHGKSEKKVRSGKAEDPLASAEEVPTERVTYLTDAKRREAHSAVSAETAELEAHPEALPVVAVPDKAAISDPAFSEHKTAILDPAAAAALEATAEFAVAQSEISRPDADGSPDRSSDRSSDGHADYAPRVEQPATEPVAETSAAAAETAPVEVPGAEPQVVEPHVVEPRKDLGEADREAIGAESAADSVASVDTPPATMSLGSASRWIAENVALTVEEASIALEAEMHQARAVAKSEPESPQQDEAASFDAPTAQTAPEAENENPTGAAFAAAASAAPSSQHSAVSIQPFKAASGDTASAPDAELPAPSEASAAWENWQHIREAVMSPQKAAALAESVAEIAQASVAAPEPTSKQDSAPSDAVSAAPAEGDNSINDIVDSVLADLKPRLMAEIAKKLAAKK